MESFQSAMLAGGIVLGLLATLAWTAFLGYKVFQIASSFVI